MDEPVQGQNEKVPSPEAQLESARQFGQGYLNVIAATLGRGVAAENADPRIRGLTEKAAAFQVQQEQRRTELQLDAHALLSQAFRTEEQQKLLEDRNGYRLEELSKGIYAVHVSPDVHKQLRPGAAATAVIVQEGVSFIYIPEYQEQASQEKNLAENIPHETHHLIWNAAGGQELFPCKESDADLAESFLLFRDELIARASSGGGLAGYHHIKILDSSEQAALEKRSPGKADAIIARVAALNGSLTELDALVQRSEKVTKQDLIQGIAQATTFDELESDLRSMKSLIESLPLKPLQTNAANADWETVAA